jgi:hypothetical protein
MRVLLSTIGSRGDVQPLVALALQLRALGRDVRLCVPPDFQTWIAGLGLEVTPIGPELRAMMAAKPLIPAPMTPERRRELAAASVATQFQTVAAAAEGCDLIVGRQPGGLGSRRRPRRGAGRRSPGRRPAVLRPALLRGPRSRDGYRRGACGRCAIDDVVDERIVAGG